MPSTTKAAVANPLARTWGDCSQMWVLVSSAGKLVISARGPRRTSPTGACMNQLAIRIHRAERREEIATSQIKARWMRLGSLPQNFVIDLQVSFPVAT